ncbi:hypothetical protein BH09MYX1_BH09MYX1_18860 [soil metagenome]
MPLTRRGPYVAFGLWVGPHSNDFVPVNKPDEPVSIAGARLKLTPKRADGHKKITRDLVRQFTKVAGDDRSALRTTSFVLPEEAGKIALE